MQRTKEIKLDGEVFSTTQYSASSGVKLLKKLSGVVMRPLAALATAGGLDAKFTPELLDNVFSGFEKLDEDEFLALVKEILSTTTTIQNKDTCPITDGTFDVIFAGKYGLLFKLLKEILAFQYADFLAGVTALQKQMTVAKPSKS